VVVGNASADRQAVPLRWRAFVIADKHARGRTVDVGHFNDDVGQLASRRRHRRRRSRNGSPVKRASAILMRAVD
jgi:hypothetical protein